MKPRSREELSKLGLLNQPPYSYFSETMKSLANHKENVKLFHSHVYYVRAALETRTGLVYSLPYVEKIMKESGWNKK